ncbi:MAG TPA: hypothetical protein VNA27_09870 [Rubrobacteraceae bacterium]|nr:hypothetical protein [Rubrobacteraceae bacterium]
MRTVQNAFRRPIRRTNWTARFLRWVLHEDSYEPLVDEHGKGIPPLNVPVAPVDP